MPPSRDRRESRLPCPSRGTPRGSAGGAQRSGGAYRFAPPRLDQSWGLTASREHASQPLQPPRASSHTPDWSSLHQHPARTTLGPTCASPRLVTEGNPACPARPEVLRGGPPGERSGVGGRSRPPCTCGRNVIPSGCRHAARSPSLNPARCPHPDRSRCAPFPLPSLAASPRHQSPPSASSVPFSALAIPCPVRRASGASFSRESAPSLRSSVLESTHLHLRPHCGTIRPKRGPYIAEFHRRIRAVSGSSPHLHTGNQAAQCTVARPLRLLRYLWPWALRLLIQP
jgi:hypothetical protein